MIESRITVHLTPRAGRDRLDGIRDGILCARVSAPPVEGEANKSLRRLIAKRVGVAQSKVTVIRGGKSRLKVVTVASLNTEALELALRDPDRRRN